MLILSVIIFLTMVVTSALTLDFMRQESVRQRIQNTADRAALAAADLNQKLAPADVVKDYFEKEGLGSVKYNLVVNQNTYGTARTVEVTANTKVNRTFADFVAPQIRDLAVKINSQAEESIGKVELSLVLDISGSMDRVPSGSTTSKTRLERMVPAAQSFVSQMFDVVQPAGSEPGRLMMSIIPYSTQVALPDYMLNAYTVSNDYTIINSNFRKEKCVDFHDSDFNSLAINPDSTLQRTMYGDSWNWPRYTRYYSSYYNHYWENCSKVTANQVLPYSNNKSKLLSKILNLDADGNTSIDFGAKWGLALLDPSAKLAMSRMIASGNVSNLFAGRPTQYGADADAMKVMVLMSDGANTDAIPPSQPIAAAALPSCPSSAPIIWISTTPQPTPIMTPKEMPRMPRPIIISAPENGCARPISRSNIRGLQPATIGGESPTTAPKSLPSGGFL